MNVATKFPTTLEERLEYGAELRIPASWEEFLRLLPDCEYRIEYDGEEIISIMGYASENHEKLALKIGHLLLALLGEEEYEFYGSNLAIYVPGMKKKFYNADATVIKGQSKTVEVMPGISAVTNPVLLVEVLSPNTERADLSQKFAHYRTIPSLQQLLFIDSTEVRLLSYTRQEQSNEWLLQEYAEKSASFPVLGKREIELTALYKKVKFDSTK